jgi:hypothetical protein
MCSGPSPRSPLGQCRDRRGGLGTFAELLIDCGEDRTLWAVLVGMLRERSAHATLKGGRCRSIARTPLRTGRRLGEFLLRELRTERWPSSSNFPGG